MSVQNPTSWTEWASLNLPQRLGNSGLSSQFAGICLTLVQDAAFQAFSEALLARCQDEPTSPDDELPYLGQEAGLPQYATEANAAFRSRLDSKWSVWSQAASQSGIVNQLLQAGFPNGTVVPTIVFNLPGGGDNGVTDPTSPYYSPEYAGTGIPLYPASNTWWSQFAVLLQLGAPIGSGAQGRSQLISNDQLQAMQLIVNKFKPANWACREIVIEYLPTSGSVVWDQLNAAGTGYLYDYDTSAITWGAGSGSLPGGDVVEHFAVSNTWRWRPMFVSATG